MTILERHFEDYAACHRDRRNKATHCLGIPLIALGLFALASRWTLITLPDGGQIDLGIALVVALVLVYLRWHTGLALGIGVFFVLLYAAGRLLPEPWPWAILGLGVGLQYLGHYAFEGRSPAFHRNAVHMLIGPLWVAALALAPLGIYRPQGR